jgi:hypothetical protein
LPRNTFLLSSDILTKWPAHSYFYCCYDSWFSIHNLQFIISLGSPAILIFYWAIYFPLYFTLSGKIRYAMYTTQVLSGWYGSSEVHYLIPGYSVAC